MANRMTGGFLRDETTGALVVSGGGAEPPRIVTGGNLGATYTLDTLGDLNVWLTGTLNANNVLTISNLVGGADGKVIVTQDATGSRTLTINGATVPVNPTALSVSEVEYVYDGTDLTINVEGVGSSEGGSITRIHGLIGQTYDLANANVGALAPSGGQRQYVAVPAQRAGTIDAVMLEVGTAGVDGGALLANCFVGVHRPDGTLIGTSADQTAAFKSLGVKTIAITVVGGQSLVVDPAVTPHLFVQILIGTQSSTAVALERTANASARCNVGLTLPAFAYATASGSLSALDSGVPGMTVPGTGTMSLGANAWWVAVGSTT